MRHRRRAVSVVVAWTLAATWIGCNAILGNESAVFEPDRSSGLPDARAEADGAVTSVDTGTERDATRDADVCVNTTSNPAHCGACFHDCLGGQCFGGVCQPVTLALDVGEILSVEANATHVYWSNRNTGDIMRIDLAGLQKERVYDGPPNSDPGKGFAIVGGHVYFPLYESVDGGAGSLVRCPVTGCTSAPETLIPNLNRPDYVSASPEGTGTILFVELGGRIGRCVAPCLSGFETIATGEVLPLRATATADMVAWSTLDFPRGGALRARIGDGGPFDVKTNATAYTLALIGDELIYAQLGAGTRATRRDGGGPVRAITLSPPPQSSDFAIDDNTLFFGDGRPAGAIFACPLAGCIDGGAPLATNQSNPQTLAVDAKSIYWATSNGAIQRLAR